MEQRVLAAARKAGAPIPNGEMEGEEPDFRFHTPTGMLGIEVSEVLCPASTNEGILLAEAESFHRSIMQKAQETYQKTNADPTRGSLYFSRARGGKQDKNRLIQSLVDCVARNCHSANPAIALEGDDLPEGFDPYSNYSGIRRMVVWRVWRNHSSGDSRRDCHKNRCQERTAAQLSCKPTKRGTDMVAPIQSG